MTFEIQVNDVDLLMIVANVCNQNARLVDLILLKTNQFLAIFKLKVNIQYIGSLQEFFSDFHFNKCYLIKDFNQSKLIPIKILDKAKIIIFLEKPNCKIFTPFFYDFVGYDQLLEKLTAHTHMSRLWCFGLRPAHPSLLINEKINENNSENDEN